MSRKPAWRMYCCSCSLSCGFEYIAEIKNSLLVLLFLLLPPLFLILLYALTLLTGCVSKILGKYDFFSRDKIHYLKCEGLIASFASFSYLFSHAYSITRTECCFLPAIIFSIFELASDALILHILLASNSRKEYLRIWKYSGTEPKPKWIEEPHWNPFSKLNPDTVEILMNNVQIYFSY